MVTQIERLLDVVISQIPRIWQVIIGIPFIEEVIAISLILSAILRIVEFVYEQFGGTGGEM